MGTEAKLHAAEPVQTTAAAVSEGDAALALAEPLVRLTGEAELVERLLSHKRRLRRAS